MAQGIFNLKQVNQAIRQGAWSAFNPPQFVEYLVVAGGGGGSAENGTTNYAGGGGAGGVLTGIVPVVAGTSYTVTVGGGGSSFTSGSNSVFGSISSTGGGNGSSMRNSSPYDVISGSAGGSGGGGSGSGTSGSTPGLQGIANQGNAGGNGFNQAQPTGGGGGGAGTKGYNGVTSSGGIGGAGIASSISGTVSVYAGGGGGGAGIALPGGPGGVGGGGGGGGQSINGIAGNVNTGGGGGGAGGNAIGGTGGSGIVVVRYPGNVVFYTGGTVNYNNGYISHIFNSNGTLAPTAPAVYDTSYQISRSLRFNGADATKLTRTPSSSTSSTLGTFSFWTKLGPLVSGNNNGTFISAADSYAYGQFYQNTLYFGNTTNYLNTTAVFRDFSAWYHIVFVFDTTQATSTNRLKIYVNNVLQTAGSLASYPTQNSSFPFLNGTQQYQIGGNGLSSSVEYYNGYMTEINFVDGQALTPSSFGATSTTTGVWAPIKYTGTYGTNGFYLNFSDNTNTTAATLGKDYSDNGNNWTPNNFSVTAGVGNDSVVDTPTPYGFDTGAGGTVRGNYATLNPLANYVATLSNGNLDLSTSTSGAKTTLSTIGISSGKWYWEMLMNASGEVLVGIADSSAPLTGFLGGGGGGGWSYDSVNGQKYNNNNTSAYGSTFTTADLIGIAFDADAGTLVFYKNNTSQGTAYSGLASNTYFPACTVYASGTSVSFNFGQRPFAYTAPSGFKALCTQNLPEPAIGGSSETLASKFFSPVLWTGDGTNPRNITGVGFQPDWVWIKGRGNQGHYLQDAVRGVTSTDSRSLSTHSTAAETNYYASNGMMNAFISDGFTTAGGSTNDNANGSGTNFVAWNWRAGNNAGSANRLGTIASIVSANPRSGFSIATYTGTGANATVGHGLGVAPAMYIVKRRDSSTNWRCYHKSLPSTYYINFNDTGGSAPGADVWNSAPTSAVFGLGTNDMNTAAGTYVAYCFAEVAGYSKFGSYTGNGSTDGPFVHLGFRPAMMIIKLSTPGVDDWVIMDVARSPYNAVNLWLNVEDTSAEATLSPPQFDFNSNGMKLRGTSSSVNTSAATYIYMAFASNPFKYSLAR